MFSKVIGVAKRRRIMPVLVAAVAVFIILGAAASQLSADREIIPYDDLEFFIEVNDTDGDAGVQLMLDGEQWKQLRMFDPEGRRLLDVKAKNSLNTQGLTEFFFESAEPSFEEVSLEEFLDRFPEGEYRFVGRTIEGDRLAGTAEFTHTIPDAPVITSPEEGEPVEIDEVVIEWEPVADPEGSEIVSYEVIVESDEAFGEFRVLLPPTATSVEVPEAVFDPEIAEYKVEILAREESGNQTITEQEFEIEIDDE